MVQDQVQVRQVLTRLSTSSHILTTTFPTQTKGQARLYSEPDTVVWLLVYGPGWCASLPALGLTRYVIMDRLREIDRYL